MADTEELGKMLDNLIKDKDDQAQVHFHDYMQTKMQSVIHGEIELDDDSDETRTNQNG